MDAQTAFGLDTAIQGMGGLEEKRCDNSYTVTQSLMALAAASGRWLLGVASSVDISGSLISCVFARTAATWCWLDNK